VPDNITTDFTGDFVTHDVDLLRLAEGERVKALRILRELEKELVVRLRIHDPGAGKTAAFTKRRIEALLKSVQKTIRTAYGRISREQAAMLKELSVKEADILAKQVNTTAQIPLFTVGVSEPVLKNLVKEPFVEGALTSEWWSRQSDDVAKKFRDQVTIGALLGENPRKIARRVVGPGGIMETKKRQAEMLVRTSVMGAANQSRMAMYQANSDVVKGVQAVVTFDLRTSDICISRAGAGWDLEGNPLPDSTRQEPFPGPPPWHNGCRTTLSPVLKSFEELLGAKGTRLDQKLKETPGTRASKFDGQIGEDVSFDQWLRRRSPAQQQQALGKKRRDLWLQGKLKLTDLVTQQGRSLTVKELQAT
jgi:hypothetical protein